MRSSGVLDAMLIMEMLATNGIFQAIWLVMVAAIIMMTAAVPFPTRINWKAYRKGTSHGMISSQER